MKFECKACEDKSPCVLTCDVRPKYCQLFKDKNARWREVTALPPWCVPGARFVSADGRYGVICKINEDTVHAKKDEQILGMLYSFDYVRNSMQPEPAALPKLTVDEPDENRFTLDGVEYGAVAHGDEVEKPCDLCDLKRGCAQNTKRPHCTSEYRRDRRNVYFRRVKPAEKHIPDWCKVGAWIYYDNELHQIDSINEKNGRYSAISISGDLGICRYYAKDTGIKPVTFRAWTAKEAELQVGKAFLFKKTGYIGVMLGFHKDRGVAFPASGELHNVYFSSLDELFEQGEQLSGLPCGIPQINGKDIEV